VFDKRHGNVLADIKNLLCRKESNLINLQELTYLNAMNREYKADETIIDGFIFLVMWYPGTKAL